MPLFYDSMFLNAPRCALSLAPALHGQQTASEICNFVPSVSPLIQLLGWVLAGWVLHVFPTQLSCFFFVLFLYFSFICHPRFLVVIPLLPLLSYILCHKYWFSLLVSLNPRPSESQVIHTLAVNVKHEYLTLQVLCSGEGTRANPRLLDTSSTVQDEEYTAAQFPSALKCIYLL